jgi:hypothetical protein
LISKKGELLDRVLERADGLRIYIIRQDKKGTVAVVFVFGGPIGEKGHRDSITRLDCNERNDSHTRVTDTNCLQKSDALESEVTSLARREGHVTRIFSAISLYQLFRARIHHVRHTF